MQDQSQAPAARLEEALVNLPGVRRVKVAAEDDAVTAVTLLVTPERDAHEVMRRVRSIAAELRIPIDEVATEILGASNGEGAPGRRKLSSLTTRRSPERFSVQIALELDGDVLVGEAEASHGRRFEHRCVAIATLKATSKLLPFPLEVESVDFLAFGVQRLAVVYLSRGTDVVVGSAMIRSEEYDAIARATLDAVNRFLVPRSG